MTAPFGTHRDDAAALDGDDPLAGFADAFHVPAPNGEPVHYLSGHSLGLMPREARALVDHELERWAALGVEGHFGDAGWLDYHARFTQPLARLTGARAREVVAMNTLTVNLHLMLASFFEPTGRRSKILIEKAAFPSDRYAVQSQLRWHGLDPADALVELEPEPDSGHLDGARFDALLEAEGERIALVLLPGVHYLTGQVLDVAAYTRSAHRHGCRIGFDLAHAVGNVPLELHDAGPDFAVWCSYKYLNAGPGAVGGCFIHERWAGDGDLPRLAGWWGHDASSRFAMPPDFAPSVGAEGWQLSNPPIFSLAPLAASLEQFERAGLPRLRQKSQRLGDYLIFLVREMLGERARIVTPSGAGERGNQMSLRIRGARSVADLARAMRRDGVVVDSREPDTLRLAAAPLYNGFSDVRAAVAALRRAL